jgi:predicted transcriptional regulator of viral defense system
MPLFGACCATIVQLSLYSGLTSTDVLFLRCCFAPPRLCDFVRVRPKDSRQSDKSRTARLVGIIKRRRIVRSREVARDARDRKLLVRAVQQGLIERRGRGLYAVSGGKRSYRELLAEACLRVSHGVICLHSALWFHGLADAAPKEIWIAIGQKARLPKTTSLPLRFVWFSGSSLTQGVVNCRHDTVPVRVYSPMKTVADCLKFRNKVGLETALEALRASQRRRTFSRGRFLHFARLCRVEALAHQLISRK